MARQVAWWVILIVPAVGLAGLSLLASGRSAAAIYPLTLSDPSFEDQLIELLNQERWENGALPPLKREPLLNTSAETHSDSMAVRDFVAHCDLDTGTWPADRMRDAGYNGFSWWGENIAVGFPTPSSVLAFWMGSAPHRNNILSTNFRQIGIGYDEQVPDLANIRLDLYPSDCTAEGFNYGPYFDYWTLNFGRINTVYPVVIEREAWTTAARDVDLYIYGDGWAQDMRFSNDNLNWSAWMSFAANATWTLSAGNGTKTVYAEVRNGAITYTASDTIELDDGQGGATSTPTATATATPTAPPAPTCTPVPTPPPATPSPDAYPAPPASLAHLPAVFFSCYARAAMPPQEAVGTAGSAISGEIK